MLRTRIVAVLGAIAVYIVGRWLIGRVIHLVQAAMHRNQIDPTLSKYFGSVLGVALNIALVLGILGYFGVQTTSFAAMLAGAGVAIGAAWSGMLGNFAAGAFMLVLRPFKVGDFVQIGGIAGTVQELGLFGTTLVTPDNVLTLVGNSKVFGDTVMNYSARPARRVDRTAQLAAGVDPVEAIAKLQAAVAAIPNVAVSPPPEVTVRSMQASRLPSRSPRWVRSISRLARVAGSMARKPLSPRRRGGARAGTLPAWVVWFDAIR